MQQNNLFCQQVKLFSQRWMQKYADNNVGLSSRNHNVLCPTLLESVPTLVVLSEDDIIVPSAAVARHMLQFPSPTTEVMVLEGHAHAQFIAMPDTCLRILERFRHVETQVVACQTVRATST